MLTREDIGFLRLFRDHVGSQAVLLRELPEVLTLWHQAFASYVLLGT